MIPPAYQRCGDVEAPVKKHSCARRIERFAAVELSGALPTADIGDGVFAPVEATLEQG